MEPMVQNEQASTYHKPSLKRRIIFALIWTVAGIGAAVLAWLLSGKVSYYNLGNVSYCNKVDIYGRAFGEAYVRGSSTNTSVQVLDYFDGCDIRQVHIEGNYLEEVEIPYGVWYVSASDCASLKNVNLPDPVYEVGFQNCTSLESIDLHDSVHDVSFEGCSSLKSIEIPGSVNVMGSVNVIGDNEYRNSFKNCTSLETVVIHNGVYLIDEGAFENCTSLKSIVIPGSVQEIRRDAFKNCTSLESVVFLDGVKSISGGSFSGCTSLKSVDLPDGEVRIAGEEIESNGYSPLAQNLIIEMLLGLV